MDLFCPHCSSRVSIPDDKAGQVTNCPQCTKAFMTPALAPPLAPPPPPAPPPVTTITAVEPEPAVAIEPVTPGSYSGALGLHLRAAWLVFVPPACLVLLYFLSFFTWHNHGDGRTPGLWSLSFTTQEGLGQFIAYSVLMILTGTLIILAFVLDTVFMPPQLAPFSKWKNLLVGLLLAFTLIPLVFDYVHAHFLAAYNPIALAEKLAIRLHFLAMLASFGLFWLHGRKEKNLPAPKVELHW
jgi:hypothetical protein